MHFLSVCSSSVDFFIANLELFCGGVLRLNDLGKRNDFVREFRHLFPHIGVNDGTLRAWVKDFVASRAARPDVKSVKYRSGHLPFVS